MLQLVGWWPKLCLNVFKPRQAEEAYRTPFKFALWVGVQNETRFS